MTKECAPTTVHVDQTITFTCMILNTSSADAPNLILNSVTDVRNPGAVVTDLTGTATAAACGSLAPAASCQFTYRFVTTAVGTITNTVTAHFHPDGFDNDITDDSTCTADVVGGEGCTPGFFKRWTNVWDEVSDPISLAVKAAVDAKGAPYLYVAGQGVTTQLFNIFRLSDAQMTAAGPCHEPDDGAGDQFGGGGFNRLARHGVAGLLSSVFVRTRSVLTWSSRWSTTPS